MTSPKFTNQNPLEDKKWLKEFAEEFKKDLKKSQKNKKTSSNGWLGEINCSQKDIGKPSYSPKKSKNQFLN